MRPAAESDAPGRFFQNIQELPIMGIRMGDVQGAGGE
jgi:hypothetical protein